MSDSPKRIGIAADHGGFESKEYLVGMLHETHFEVVDFGDSQAKPDDDYPDFVVPLAWQLLAAKWIAAWPSAVVAWVRALPPIRYRAYGRA